MFGISNARRLPIAAAAIFLFSLFVFANQEKIAFAQQGPDISITNIAADDQCRIVVTLANTGTQVLTVTAYDQMLGPSVQIYKGSESWGGWRLEGVDPEKKLKNPGGTITWTSGKVLIGTEAIKVTFDPNNVLKEPNRTNNSMTKTLTCNPPLPDLKLSGITFAQDCRAIIKVENAGDGSLKDGAYSAAYGVYIQRFIDGNPGGQISMNALDPTKKLKVPGGVVEWTDGQEYKAKDNIKYELKRLGDEKSAENNAMQTVVPDRCKEGAAPTPPREMKKIEPMKKELPDIKR